MSYRIINVLLSPGKDIERVSSFAADLAGCFGARLSAQFLEYFPSMAKVSYGQVAALAAQFEEGNRKTREHEKEAFASLAGRNGLRFDWRSVYSSNWPDMIPLTRTSDIVVMGQPNPEDGQSVLGMTMAGNVLLQSGRPVIFLPHAMPAPKRYGTIAIAWDGSRQAARAISDSMPFMYGADEIWVLCATKEKDATQRLPDVDLGTYLAEHDLNVKIIENSNIGIDAGNWILSTAADIGADLLVMGAYGHSRFGEMLLGGVTRTILQTMTLPTIMSH